MRPAFPSLVIAFAAAVAASVPSPARAEGHPPFFHLRTAVGPVGIVGRGKDTPIVESPTRQAQGSYSTGYGGGGVAVEVAPGFTLNRTTVELFAASFEWYRAAYFDTDRSDLDRMRVSLGPAMRAFFIGFGLWRPFAQDSIWQFGAAGSLGFVEPHLGTSDGEVKSGFGYLAVASGMVGPRWPLTGTRPDAPSLLTLGAHLRASVGFGSDYFGSLAVLTDIAFQ